MYEWKISGKSWTMDLKNGAGAVKDGSAGKADCTLTMDEKVFLDLMAGKVNAQQGEPGSTTSAQRVVVAHVPSGSLYAGQAQDWRQHG